MQVCLCPITCEYKVYFHVKFKLFVTAKYDQDPDQHLFDFLDPDPH